MNIILKNNKYRVGIIACVILTFCGVALYKVNVNANTTNNSTKYFTSVLIEEGDTLWDISTEYITDDYASIDDYITEVKNINNIHQDYITAGCYITVPYYK